MLIIENYKTSKNKYEINGDTTLITILTKKNKELIAKIDTCNLEKVQAMGTWFGEWNKDFNTYLANNLTITKNGKKIKSTKRNLQSLILGTNNDAPIKHINGDVLDNRRCNLEMVDRNARNDYEKVDQDTIAVILRDKYGREQAKALISKEDLDIVVNDDYTWTYFKGSKQPKVIAHTPEGKVYLDTYLMSPSENMRTHHINLNPLDNRRLNLENKEKEVKEEVNSTEEK